MRILVCGGRKYDSWNTIDWHLSNLYHSYGDLVIIQGGATGADFLAKVWVRYANEQGFNIFCEEYPANWDKYKRAAGMIRNKQMLEEGKPDLVVAFPGGNGTKGMIKLAKQSGVEVIEIGNSNSKKKEVQATERSCCMGEKTEETHVCCGRC